jgi:short-subunit dehydrogenase
MNAAAFQNQYGPWAVVAGASEGLGAAFARELAQRHVHLVLVARSTDKLAALQQELQGRYSIDCRVVTLDLSQDKAAAFLARETAGLDIGLVVYNAALSLVGSFLGYSEEQHRAIITTNCLNPALCLYRFGQRFKERGRGGFIIMSSLAGFQGTPFIAHYAGSKAYLTVLAEGLSREYAPYGIDIIACCAGATATPGYLKSSRRAGKSPMVMSPEQVARRTVQRLPGHGIYVPGLFNKIGSVILRKFLPRAAAVSIMEHSARALQQGQGMSTKP